ncbi:hypothetical protein LJC07_07715, partial [Christensenellaceae bacterium OttesenSCG-928-L17]|nr:hypothetical protein [Christensenellaceae bacterium OttesenSCG-928-L17]
MQEPGARRFVVFLFECSQKNQTNLLGIELTRQSRCAIVNTQTPTNLVGIKKEQCHFEIILARALRPQS